MGNRLDLTDKKFGKWTVIKFAERRQSGLTWLCHCKCGKERIVRGDYLRNGRSKSCGCSRKLPKGISGFNNLYYKYQRSAKKKNLIWALTEKQFRKLIKSNCHYCGIGPNQYIRKGKNGEYIYNGIDRKNNDKGYTSNNCVPCCVNCNYSKRKCNYKEFKAWIKRLVSYQLSKRKADVI